MKINYEKCLPESVQMLKKAEKECRRALAWSVAAWVVSAVALILNTLIVLEVI